MGEANNQDPVTIPTYISLQRVAQLLGVSLDELREREHEHPLPPLLAWRVIDREDANLPYHATEEQRQLTKLGFEWDCGLPLPIAQKWQSNVYPRHWNLDSIDECREYMEELRKLASAATRNADDEIGNTWRRTADSIAHDLKLLPPPNPVTLWDVRVAYHFCETHDELPFEYWARHFDTMYHPLLSELSVIVIDEFAQPTWTEKWRAVHARLVNKHRMEPNAAWGITIDELHRVLSASDEDPSKADEAKWSKPKPPSQWAKLFGYLDHRTFLRMIDTGKIRTQKINDKSYRIHIDDLPK